MPATKPRPEGTPAAADKADSGVKYVKCDLTSAQKTSLTEWSATLPANELLGWLDTKVTDGHVLSIRSNEVGYQCSVTGMREASGHHGRCLVARASTAMRAVHSAMYKDKIVLQGKWDVLQGKDELDF